MDFSIWFPKNETGVSEMHEHSIAFHVVFFFYHKDCPCGHSVYIWLFQFIIRWTCKEDYGVYCYGVMEQIKFVKCCTTHWHHYTAQLVSSLLNFTLKCTTLLTHHSLWFWSIMVLTVHSQVHIFSHDSYNWFADLYKLKGNLPNRIQTKIDILSAILSAPYTINN